MTPTLRIVLAAALLASAASGAQARSLRILPGEPLRTSYVAGPSLPTTSSLLSHVSANGTTKPPGSALDGRLGTSPALDHASHRLGGLVRMAICTGC